MEIKLADFYFLHNAQVVLDQPYTGDKSLHFKHGELEGFVCQDLDVKLSKKKFIDHINYILRFDNSPCKVMSIKNATVEKCYIQEDLED